MRRLLHIGLVLALASCAPPPAAMLAQLREVADTATHASEASKKVCAAGLHDVPACAVTALCLDHLKAAAHACNGALITAATATGSEYAAAAHRCTDSCHVALALCRAAGVQPEEKHGAR